MNNTLYVIAIVALLILAGILILSPGKTVAPEGDTPIVTETQEPGDEEAVEYQKTINTSSSSIEWTGSKKFVNGYKDEGTVALLEGGFNMSSEGKVTGEVLIDMNSIVVTKTGIGGGFAGLEKDLKSENFFDVANYPTATFVVTDSSEHTLSGDLTIKGVTKPATVKVSERNEMEQSIKGTATIDRTEFGIDFRNEGLSGVVKEQIIADELELDFTIFYN